MKVSNFIKIISTGFIVLLLMSLVLFWLRWICDYSLYENMSNYADRNVSITPSKLVPSEVENNPVVSSKSAVTAAISFPCIEALGVVQYLISMDPGMGNSNVFWFVFDRYNKEWNGLYFDEKSGLIVYHTNVTELLAGDIKRRKEINYYAGPEGVSENPDKKLGKFFEPIMNITRDEYNNTLYDKKLKRFFRIDYKDQTVFQGPQLSKNDTHKPIQLGLFGKNSHVLFMDGHPPLAAASDADTEKGIYPSVTSKSYRWNTYDFYNGKYLFVVDKSCRIDMLDKETLEFVGVAGRLSSPSSCFVSRDLNSTDDLLGYEITPVFWGPENEYRGMFTASINREGTAVSLTVYDANGTVVAIKESGYDQFSKSTSSAIYGEVPGGPALGIMKYLLENLHPPVLLLASFLTADKIEAVSGHKGLFIMPNSFIAMKSRSYNRVYIEKIISCGWFMVVSMIISVLLAILVRRDAMVYGYSKNARLFWGIGIIAFGLVGYITYWLTKPKSTLVTCPNCGKPRRPDMEKCHSCNNGWYIPELAAPSWRILG